MAIFTAASVERDGYAPRDALARGDFSALVDGKRAVCPAWFTVIARGQADCQSQAKGECVGKR